MITPHIRISSDKDHTILQVDTWELKDFLEDFLTEECDIEYEYFEDINPELRATNGESYNLYYSDSYTDLEIIYAIQKIDEKKIQEIVDYQRIQANGKFYCPCCGYNSLTEPPGGTYNICKICFWEDCSTQLDNPNYSGGANRVSLIQAQNNFEKYGACEKQLVKNVIKPKKTDIRNPNWKIC